MFLFYLFVFVSLSYRNCAAGFRPWSLDVQRLELVLCSGINHAVNKPKFHYADFPELPRGSRRKGDVTGFVADLSRTSRRSRHSGIWALPVYDFLQWSPPPRRSCNRPLCARMCMSVCLSVPAEYLKNTNGFLWDFPERWGVDGGRIDKILVAIQILTWILGYFPGFFNITTTTWLIICLHHLQFSFLQCKYITVRTSAALLT